MLTDSVFWSLWCVENILGRVARSGLGCVTLELAGTCPGRGMWLRGGACSTRGWGAEPAKEDWDAGKTGTRATQATAPHWVPSWGKG